jgi:membrane protein DedA with SNARE-associated domain
MLIESASIPLPSEIIMGISGYLVYKGEMNLIVAGLAGAIGNILGSSIMYYIGSRGGRPVVKKYGKYLHFDEERFDKVDRWFAKWGDKTVFACQLLPVIRTFVSLPAGILRINFFRFIVYTFAGAFIWCTFLAYIASLLGPEWEKLSQLTHEFEIVMVIAIALIIALFVIRLIYKRRQAAIETE